MTEDKSITTTNSEKSLNNKPDGEPETWFESINEAFPKVNLNYFRETIELSEKVFKNIKKNYGS
mgnify:CR=1 FL=1